jgi:hypothetical protein
VAAIYDQMRSGEVIHCNETYKGRHEGHWLKYIRAGIINIDTSCVFLIAFSLLVLDYHMFALLESLPYSS